MSFLHMHDDDGTYLRGIAVQVVGGQGTGISGTGNFVSAVQDGIATAAVFGDYDCDGDGLCGLRFID